MAFKRQERTPKPSQEHGPHCMCLQHRLERSEKAEKMARVPRAKSKARA